MTSVYGRALPASVAACAAAALAGAALLLGSGGDRAIGDGLSPDTPRITAAQRAAGARFAAGVPEGDRAWIVAGDRGGAARRRSA